MKLDEKTTQEAVKVYKALGEPTRLKIIQLLLKTQELSCTEIEEQANIFAKSTLSHHMKQLSDCGLVELRKEGIYHYYSLNLEIVKRYAAFLLD